MESLDDCKRAYKSDFGEEPENALVDERSDRMKGCLMTQTWGVQFFPNGQQPCISWDSGIDERLDNYACYCKKSNNLLLKSECD